MKVCLFGSGRKEIDKKYLDEGYQFGKALAINNHSLVFGGGNDGMMGSVARGCHENNGHILGIIPEWMFEFEELFEECDNVISTEGMHDRKLNFIEQSDVFVIYPGGIGTLDELFEVFTLKKVKKHDKPIIIVNIDHFFDKLFDMLTEMIEKGFINHDDKELILITENLDETMNYLNNLK